MYYVSLLHSRMVNIYTQSVRLGTVTVKKRKLCGCWTQKGDMEIKTFLKIL